MSPLPVGQLTDKPASLKGKIFQRIRTNLFIPDGRVGWIPFAYRKAKKIIKQQDVKIVFCSSPPHSLQLVGYRLKKKFGIPLVVDFRDPWTKIQYYQRSKRSKLAEKIDENLELKVLQQANHLTTVSSTVADSFLNKLAGSGKELFFSILTNGWDPDDFKNIVRRKATDFIILHTGNLNATQIPAVLFQAVQELVEERPGSFKKIKIKFIGKVHSHIQDAVNTYNLQTYVEFLPFMSHQSIVEEICNACLLFSVIPNVPDNKGIVMSKNFEYIGTGNPILVIGPADSDIGKIISEIPNNKICNYQDKKGCKQYLEKIIGNWTQNKVYRMDNSFTDKYSRRHIAENLSQIFEDNIQ